jgi:hypothetical protein
MTAPNTGSTTNIVASKRRMVAILEHVAVIEDGPTTQPLRMTPKAICHRMIRAARAIIADKRTFQKPLTPSVSGYRNEFF